MTNHASTEILDDPSFLECAYHYWVAEYRKHRRCETVWSAHQYGTGLFENLVEGVGTLAVIFPETHYTVTPSCFPSADEAWLDDWYRAGANLYKAIVNVKQEDFAVHARECLELTRRETSTIPRIR